MVIVQKLKFPNNPNIKMAILNISLKLLGVLGETINASLACRGKSAVNRSYSGERNIHIVPPVSYRIISMIGLETKLLHIKPEAPRSETSKEKRGRHFYYHL